MILGCLCPSSCAVLMWFFSTHQTSPALASPVGSSYIHSAAKRPAPSVIHVFEKQGKTPKPNSRHIKRTHLRTGFRARTLARPRHTHPRLNWDNHTPRGRSPSEKEERRKHLHYYHPFSHAF